MKFQTGHDAHRNLNGRPKSARTLSPSALNRKTRGIVGANIDTILGNLAALAASGDPDPTIAAANLLATTVKPK